MDEDKAFARILIGIFLAIVVLIVSCLSIDKYHERRMAEKGLCYQFQTYLPCDLTKQSK